MFQLEVLHHSTPRADATAQRNVLSRPPDPTSERLLHFISSTPTTHNSTNFLRPIPSPIPPAISFTPLSLRQDFQHPLISVSTLGNTQFSLSRFLSHSSSIFSFSSNFSLQIASSSSTSFKSTGDVALQETISLGNRERNIRHVEALNDRMQRVQEGRVREHGRERDVHWRQEKIEVRRGMRGS
jgi:hypothetical protein